MSEADRQWPVTVKLKHPVDFGSERITSLEFRRGRLGDLKGMKVDGVPPVDQLLLVASRLCGQPTKVLEMLEDDDGSEVLELALGFFARCLGAGKTP
jgi:hypothetical protein